MKTAAEKSSTVSRMPQQQQSSGPFFAKANSGGFFAPAIQPKMRVGQPGDKFEKEADDTADKVMRMPEPAGGSQAGILSRQVDEEQVNKMDNEEVQRQEEEQVQKMEEEEAVQMAEEEEEIQRVEEEESIQRMEEEGLQKMSEEEEHVQRTEKEGEEEIQRMEEEEESVQMMGIDKEEVQRSEEQEIVQKSDKEEVQRQAKEEQVQKMEQEKVQRKGNGTPTVTPSIQSGISNQMTGGQKMGSETQGFMESRFSADFSNVKIHSDNEAAGLSNQLSARAFTYKNHIFFAKNQYQPGTDSGKHLLAHELTHTIQQGASVQRKPTVTTNSPTPQVQRLGISDALDYFADRAYHIPGFRMFTIVLGLNPINMSRVDRSAANILRAIVELIPGGHFITQALETHGVFNDAGAFIERQIATLGMTGSMIRKSIMDFLNSLGWRDIFRLGSVWDRAKRIFTAPISRLISFGKNLVKAVLKMVKDAILRPLAGLAQNTRGYDLIKAILGKDPITGDPYPRTADTIIGGFMKLIGQEEIWNNIKKGNAVARAWAWAQQALAGIMAIVTSIPGRVMATLSSLSWQDVLTVVGIFKKVGGLIFGIVGNFVSWAGRAMWDLLEILFIVVAPGAMPYLKKVKSAFKSILKNPIGFVSNLVKAGKRGFQRFSANIMKHLKKGLLNWLLGSLQGAGIYLPKALSAMEIIKFVFSILNFTWGFIRAKLVKLIGEPAVAALEKGFSVVATLVKEGPAAAWEQIKEMASELKNTFISEIVSFVTTKIVQVAVVKLLSMLNPAGAVIQAIMAIWDSISFFVEKIKQIARVGKTIIDSLANIAKGAIGKAITKVESTLAGMLTLAINFLAKFAKLDKISKVIKNIIDKIRKPISKAVDKVVMWLKNKAKKFIRSAAGVPKDPKERLKVGMQKAVKAVNKFAGKKVGKKLLTPLLGGIKAMYGFQKLEVFEKDKKWWILGEINPKTTTGTKVGVGESSKVLELVGIKLVRRNKTVNDRLLDFDKGKSKGYKFPLQNGTLFIQRIEDLGEERTPTVHLDEEGKLQKGLGKKQTKKLTKDEIMAKYKVSATVADAILARADLAKKFDSVAGNQAHHIIPISALTRSKALQRLVESGWDFNQKINGILLKEGFHGNHPYYTDYAVQQLQNWYTRNKKKTISEIQTFVESTLIPRLTGLISKAKEKYDKGEGNLNDFFRALIA